MSNNTKFLITVVAVVAIVGIGYVALVTPEDRSAGEKVEDAISSLDNGVDDAARQLEDRSPSEKISDGIDDATDGNAN